MKEIDEYVDSVFEKEVLLEGKVKPAVKEAAKARVRANLEREYAACLEAGMEEAAALLEVCGNFGADKGKASAIAYEELVVSHDKFLRLYPRLRRIGYAGIIIWPVFMLAFLFQIEQKVVFIAIWVVYMLLLAAYVITIEYMEYRFKRFFDEQKEKTDA